MTLCCYERQIKLTWNEAAALFSNGVEFSCCTSKVNFFAFLLLFLYF
jgi:hypothetical protein